MTPASNGGVAVVVNPTAGRMPGTLRERVTDELRRRFDAEVLTTHGRDAAIGIARELAEAGARLVIALGGDGHVNEIANGVVKTDTRLGVVPGGTMNVFARSLGVPLDPLTAVDHLEQAIDRDPKTVPLGRMDDRYFTFSAGCGFDAEVAELVERDLQGKRRFGEMFFYWSAFRVLASSFRRRAPTMTLRGSFGEERAAMAIASNAGPYAYFVGRPVNIAPDVRLDRGLDIFGLRTMRLESLPFYVWRVAVSGDLVNHPDSFYQRDLDALEVTSDEYFGRHVDGEPLAPAKSVRFSIEKDVLSVVV